MLVTHYHTACTDSDVKLTPLQTITSHRITNTSVFTVEHDFYICIAKELLYSLSQQRHVSAFS